MWIADIFAVILLVFAIIAINIYLGTFRLGCSWYARVTKGDGMKYLWYKLIDWWLK